MSHEHPTTDIVIDIETYADMSEEVFEAKCAQLKAPANWKDPAKIEAYIEEAKAKLIDKAALSPLTGRVVAVGMGVRREGGAWEYGCFVDEVEDEAALLRQTDGALSDIGHGFLVTFNGVRFDVPFMAARAMRHRLSLEYRWPIGRYAKRHIDLCALLGDGSLDEWAALVLGESKQSSGSEIGGMVAAEDWAGIREHCLTDIRMTAELYDALESCAWIDRR